jgi:hypothetical protein
VNDVIFKEDFRNFLLIGVHQSRKIGAKSS